MKPHFLAICLLAASRFLFAQTTSNIQQPVSINSGGISPDASAMLDVHSTDKGMLVPWMTTAQREAIASPATGLLVFDTDTNTFWFSDNGFWTELVVTAPAEMGSNPTSMPIPDCDPVGITSNITLIQPGVVEVGSEFKVCLDITHTRADDMDISLESPGGTVIVLSSDNGGGGDNYTGTCFTSVAVNPITGGTAPFTGNWMPEEPFSTFIGDTIAGDWTLHVVDDKCSQTGQLNLWSIQILSSSGNANAIVDSDNDTKVSVETFDDEDIIRFDLGGTEHFVMDGPRLAVKNSGGSVFIGSGAGANDDLGDNQNVAVGDSALSSNTTAFSNTANGYLALSSNTTCNSNTANGSIALFLNISGHSNTANGVRALFWNTTGDLNTAAGRDALFSNTTGHDNTATGAYALYYDLTGSDNTATGWSALYYNTTGNSNTGIGMDADVSVGNLGNSTAIGFNTTVNASDKVRIGSTSVTVIEGQVDWSFPSDARFKFNIHDDAVQGLAFIEKLRPVTYQFDTRKFDEHLMQHMPDSIRQRRMAGQDYSEGTATVQTGFLAQEVEQACKDLGFEFSGLHVPTSEVDNYGLAYGSFVPLLVKAVQEQQQIIEHGKWKMENGEFGK